MQSSHLSLKKILNEISLSKKITEFKSENCKYNSINYYRFRENRGIQYNSYCSCTGPLSHQVRASAIRYHRCTTPCTTPCTRVRCTLLNRVTASSKNGPHRSNSPRSSSTVLKFPLSLHSLQHKLVLSMSRFARTRTLAL